MIRSVTNSSITATVGTNMTFTLEQKVALITGGASGIGFQCALALLRNGIKGVTLADVNPKKGEEAIKIIETEFGSGKALYIPTDVTDKQQLYEAFDKTIKVFENVDILINNAGFVEERMWEKIIAINLNGLINGIFMGINNFLSTYHQEPEGVVVNLASMAGLHPSKMLPVYSATKCAVIGITRAMAAAYPKSRVRVLAVCPGLTNTDMGNNIYSKGQPGKFYEPERTDLYVQEPSHLAKEIIRIIKYAHNNSIWVVDGGPAFEYKYPNVQSMKDNLLTPH